MTFAVCAALGVALSVAWQKFRDDLRSGACNRRSGPAECAQVVPRWSPWPPVLTCGPRTMPSDDAKIPDFPADDSQDFATGSRFSQDFLRKSDDA